MSINISGSILKILLSDPTKGLEIWPRLKLTYFDSEYVIIYNDITRFYNKFNKLPNFEELKVNARNGNLLENIIALELLEVSEQLDLLILFEALINEFTQKQALLRIDKFIDKITFLECDEIKKELSEIVLYLDEKTHRTDEVVLMSDLTLVDIEEIESRIALGLNNTFDANNGGIPPTELFLLGGFRGAGKSVICTNIVANQYRQGNIGLYFSIEMRGREIFNRTIGCLSGADATRIRKGICTKDELIAIAKVRADMFMEGQEVFNKFLDHNNYTLFEKELLSSKQLKTDNQIIIIDDQKLSIPSIDLYLQKYKSQFNDKLRVAVIDYINAIDIDDAYDWKSQLTLSAHLKELARKYKIVIVAPYQIDEKGGTRFSKGILDKADIAAILEAGPDYVKFSSVKTRNIPPFEFASPINWNTLQMSAEDAYINEEGETDTKTTLKQKEQNVQDAIEI